MKRFRYLWILLLAVLLAVPVSASEPSVRYETEVVAQCGNYYPGSNRMINENWSQVYKSGLTFDRLDSNTVLNAPWVAYILVAPQDGKYQIGFGFLSGGSCPNREVFFGLQVNSGFFQKVNFTYDNAAYVQYEIVELELKEGENHITVTGALKDFMNYPNFPSQYGGTGLWIDHDYITVPQGVTVKGSDRLSYRDGDSESDVDLSVREVWSSTVATPAVVPDPPVQPGPFAAGWVWLLVIGGCALAAEAIVLVRMAAGKKNSPKP